MNREKEEQQLAQEAAHIVELATKAGADIAIAAVNRRSEFEVELRNGTIENLSEADYNTLSLTVAKNNSRASVTSCDLSDQSITTLVDQALAMCKYTDPDPFFTLPDLERQATENPDLDQFDDAVRSIHVNDKIQRVRDLEEHLRDDNHEITEDSSSLSTLWGTSGLANSQGFAMGRSSSLISMGTSIFTNDTVQEGDLNTGRKQTSSWVTRARHVEDLESGESVAQTAISRLIRKLGGRKPPSGKVPCYFEPNSARVLWSHLLSGISGGNVYREESYLKGRIHERVASPLVQIVDDPTLIRGLGSRNYDSEGVLATKQTLIEDGILQTYMMGTYSSKKLGLKSTGHAGGYSNLLIRPGEFNEEEMLAKMGTGIWVISFLGQGVNVSNGDYSRGAFGIWVENGVPQYPVQEFTINSNLDHMFKNIIMIGNNVNPRYSIRTPGLVIEEMNISGL